MSPPAKNQHLKIYFQRRVDFKDTLYNDGSQPVEFTPTSGEIF